MANAITTVSKQLENVHEALASSKRHLSKKLENLDLKVEEQKEITQLIANDNSSRCIGIVVQNLPRSKSSRNNKKNTPVISSWDFFDPRQNGLGCMIFLVCVLHM
ncbi:hypothetical protein C1H46_014266 [Malus baccata]|uniref:DUF1664 domain-containing protein n=1 Tax=Malus baccata TaxID=106549 RepID=A0A540MMY5_MALBA|nr:hypothetical protein C1H46_014266 [Malus baccata]